MIEPPTWQATGPELRHKFFPWSPERYLLICFGHSLNLAVCYTIKQCKLTKDILDVAHEISKLVKFHQNAMQSSIRSKSFLPMPPVSGYFVPRAGLYVRKACRVCLTIMSYYSSSGNVFWIVMLCLTWEPGSSEYRHIWKHLISIFDYYFGVCIGELVLSHADNLSAALQKSPLSAAENHCIVTMTKDTIVKIHRWMLWHDLGVSEDRNSLSSRCRTQDPQATKDALQVQQQHTFKVHTLPPDLFWDPWSCNLHHQDTVWPAILCHIPSDTKDLLIRSARGEDSSSELNAVIDFYEDDFSDKECLVVQLKFLETQFEDQREVDLRDLVVTVLRNFYSA